jgi:hypothetical protein
VTILPPTSQVAQVDVVNPILQYGAIGIVALIALYAVSKLFARQVAAHDKDIARADRLEAELREQNKVIQEKLVVQLTLATEAIATLLAEQSKARNR